MSGCCLTQELRGLSGSSLGKCPREEAERAWRYGGAHEYAHQLLETLLICSKLFGFPFSCPSQDGIGEPEVGCHRARSGGPGLPEGSAEFQYNPADPSGAPSIPASPPALGAGPLGSSICNRQEPGVRANILCMELTKWGHLETKIAVNASTHLWNILNVCVCRRGDGRQHQPSLMAPMEPSPRHSNKKHDAPRVSQASTRAERWVRRPPPGSRARGRCQPRGPGTRQRACPKLI